MPRVHVGNLAHRGGQHNRNTSARLCRLDTGGKRPAGAARAAIDSHAAAAYRSAGGIRSLLQGERLTSRKKTCFEEDDRGSAHSASRNADDALPALIFRQRHSISCHRVKHAEADDDHVRQARGRFREEVRHDEELRFKANARRNKLLGRWAAEKLGLSGAEADAYAKEVVVADFEESGDDDVFRKVRKDFDDKGVKRIRSSDSPHHGRADGKGDRRDQGELGDAPRAHDAARRRCRRTTLAAAGTPASRSRAIGPPGTLPSWVKLLRPFRGMPAARPGDRIVGRPLGAVFPELPLRQSTFRASIPSGGQNIRKRRAQCADDAPPRSPKREQRIRRDTSQASGRATREGQGERRPMPSSQLGLQRRAHSISPMSTAAIAPPRSTATPCWPGRWWRATASSSSMTTSSTEVDATSASGPSSGIDAFLAAFEGQYRVLHRAYQIGIAKTGLELRAPALRTGQFVSLVRDDRMGHIARRLLFSHGSPSIRPRLNSRSPAGCAPARPSIAAGVAWPLRSSPSSLAAKVFPPSRSTGSTGCGTPPRS